MPRASVCWLDPDEPDTRGVQPTPTMSSRTKRAAEEEDASSADRAPTQRVRQVPPCHHPSLRKPPPTRAEQLAAWTSLVDRLRREGGHVHEGVSVGWSMVRSPDGDPGSDDERGLVATADIPVGAELFRIPASATVSAATALASRVGRGVRAAVEAAARMDDEEEDAEGGGPRHHGPRLPLGDLALAAFVAHDSLDPSSVFAPYYRLLDAETFDGSPAWWPTDERRALLAGSCVLEAAESLSQDVKHDFERFVRQTLEEEENEGGVGGALDSGAVSRVRETDGGFERFRRAVAAVHSRSFNTGGGEAESEAAGCALVPLLDCANHFRKPREAAWSAVDADPAQAAGAGEREEGDPATGGKTIVVTALRRFAAGDPIRIAYGARGNAELMLRYGFTVLDNTEPDGSSNDVVPLTLGTGGDAVTVELRVASRTSYTYTPLAKAVDALKREAELGRARRGDAVEGSAEGVQVTCGGNRVTVEEEDEDWLLGGAHDDDEEDGDGSGWGDLYGGGDDTEDAEGENEEELFGPGADDWHGDDWGGGEVNVTMEAAALKSLSDVLKTRMSAIASTTHESSRRERMRDPRASACSTLLLSESLTLSFYANVADAAAKIISDASASTAEDNEDGDERQGRARVKETLAARLGAYITGAAEVGDGGDQPPENVKDEIEAMRWRTSEPHIASLVKAYFQIRHGIVAPSSS